MNQNYSANLYRQRLKKTMRPTKRETLLESVRSVTKEYCKESSISGLKHLVEERTPHIEKAIWTITLIAALICSVSLVWMTFQRYYQAPLVTTQIPEGISINKIIFPAVGICTNNRISKRAVTELANALLKEKRNEKYNEKKMLSMLFGLGLLYNLQMDPNIVDVMELHQTLGEYDVNELMKNLQFSDAYDFPDAPSGSFSMQIVSPHVQLEVLASASFTEASRDIEHVSLKLRKCLFFDESSYLPFYTHSDCLLKCRMSFLMEKCNCTPFNMPKIRNTKTCDLTDVPCLTKYHAQSTTVRPDLEEIPPELELDLVGGGIYCPMCYPTCSKTTYNYDYTNVHIFPDHVNPTPDKDKIDWL
ncbi:unnamed protein product [Pieris macdunnoughi]|uniref:Sodium channel protein Nach n=1 Tax=Pieris macdunnoughi TaxID=345717 RepID=A0A821W3B7_9NEOP|nr:unnamed protein product [Pieris macdunnoughi]